MKVTFGPCNCRVPDRFYEKDYVGDWYVQLEACYDCGALLTAHVNHLAEIEGADP